jgi:hypothetical protein
LDWKLRWFLCLLFLTHHVLRARARLINSGRGRFVDIKKLVGSNGAIHVALEFTHSQLNVVSIG